MFSAALSWFNRPRRDKADEPLPVPQLDPDWPHCLADPTPQFVPVPVAQPDDEPALDTPAGEDRRLFDDAGQPIRIPGDEAPANPHPATGLRFPRAVAVELPGLPPIRLHDLRHTAAPVRDVARDGVTDYRAAAATPPPVYDGIVASLQGEYAQSAAQTASEGIRGQGWPEPPDYSRTGRVLASIDEVIAGPLAERLRRVAEDRYARAEAARVEADSRARTAEGQFALEKSLRQDTQVRLVQVEAERDAALKRIAELELTVRALGGLVAHAAGHDTTGERGTEGGE